MTQHVEDQAGGSSSEVDAALMKIPRLGRWRLCTYTMICLGMNMIGAWQTAAFYFIGYEPASFSCKDHAGMNDVCDDTSQNIKCPTEHQFNDDGMGNSIVTDFDLVCERKHLLMTSQTVFGVGMMVGALVFPLLSDRFGRRLVHMVCHGLLVVFGLGLAFSNNMTTFNALRFIVGALREGIMLSGIVMVVEMFPAIDRTVAGTAVNFFWSLALALLSLIAYGIRNWRHLQVALTVPGVLTLSYLWLLPESVPWLVARGRQEEAEEVLDRAARIDGITDKKVSFFLKETPEKKDSEKKNDPDQTETAGPLEEKEETIEMREAEEGDNRGGQAEPEGKETAAEVPEDCACVGEGSVDRKGAELYSLIDMCKSPRVLVYASLMCFVWFVDHMVYHMIIGGLQQLSGDPYLIFFINSLIEIPAYGLTTVLLQVFGRRWPLAMFHVVTGFSLLGALYGGSRNYGVPGMAFAMLAKFSASSALAVIFLYVTEIHVTSLRMSGVGLASLCGRLGAILTPVFLHKVDSGSSKPLYIFTILSLLAVPVGVALPETGDKPLPQTLDAVEKWQDGCSSTRQVWRRQMKKACDLEEGSEAEDTLKAEEEAVIPEA